MSKQIIYDAQTGKVTEVEIEAEDMTAEEIQEIKDAAIPAGPTLDERVDLHDTKIVTLEETLDAVFGGV